MPSRAFDWYVRFALVAAVVLVAGLTVRSRSLIEAYDDLYRRAETPHAGIFLPPVATSTLEGRPVVLAEPGEGGVQVLFYFTTSCPYCRASIPAWNEIAARAAEQGASVYAISLSPAEEAAVYAREHGLTYPIVTLPHRKYAALYRTRRVPQTVVVDSAGQVAFGRSGALTERAAIDSVLAAVTALIGAASSPEDGPIVLR